MGVGLSLTKEDDARDSSGRLRRKDLRRKDLRRKDLRRKDLGLRPMAAMPASRFAWTRDKRKRAQSWRRRTPLATTASSQNSPRECHRRIQAVHSTGHFSGFPSCGHSSRKLSVLASSQAYVVCSSIGNACCHFARFLSRDFFARRRALFVCLCAQRQPWCLGMVLSRVQRRRLRTIRQKRLPKPCFNATQMPYPPQHESERCLDIVLPICSL